MPLFINTEKVLGSGTYGKVYSGMRNAGVNGVMNPIAMKLCREAVIADTVSSVDDLTDPPLQWSQSLQPILREINALYALDYDKMLDDCNSQQSHTVHLQQVVDRRRRLGPRIEAQGWAGQFNAPLVIDQVSLPTFQSCARLDGVLVAMDQMFCSLDRVLYDQPISAVRSLLQMDRIRSWIRQLYVGIHEIHQEGLVHRDLKPQNLLLSRDASTLKIADFGLAHVKMVEPIDDEHVKYIEEIGTPQMVTLWYRPPEILDESVNIYSNSVDLWSCACIVAELFRTMDAVTTTNAADAKPHSMHVGHSGQMPSRQVLFNVALCQNPDLDEEGLRQEDIKNMLALIHHIFQSRGSTNVCGLSTDFQTKWPIATEFMQWILQLDPQKRPSSKAIMQHPFLN